MTNQKVITICPNAHRLSRQTSRNIDVIYPWADNSIISPLDRSSNPFLTNFIDEDEFVVLYSGNMGKSHDISSILECARSMLDYKLIRFIFIGDGDGRSLVENYIKLYPNGNVRLFPYQDEEFLPFTLSLADISIVSLDSGMEDLMIPSKLFYYLASGSAILAISNTPSSLTDILLHKQCGSIVSPNKPHLLVSEILKMYNDPNLLETYKTNSHNLSLDSFSLKSGIKQFLLAFQRVGIAP